MFFLVSFQQRKSSTLTPAEVKKKRDQIKQHLQKKTENPNDNFFKKRKVVTPEKQVWFDFTCCLLFHWRNYVMEVNKILKHIFSTEVLWSLFREQYLQCERRGIFDSFLVVCISYIQALSSHYPKTAKPITSVSMVSFPFILMYQTTSHPAFPVSLYRGYLIWGTLCLLRLLLVTIWNSMLCWLREQAGDLCIRSVHPICASKAALFKTYFKIQNTFQNLSITISVKCFSPLHYR